MTESDISYTCSCGEKISATFPSSYVLKEEILGLIASGQIFSLECADCGRKLKVDSSALFEFPEDSYKIYLIPEKMRTAYLLGKWTLEIPCDRLAIGLKELQEKILLRKNHLDDQTIEAIKLPFLTRMKKNLEIFFKELKDDKLFFYVDGLKPGEIGITSFPLSVYEHKHKEKDQWMENPDYLSFLTPPYVSISQIDVEED